ncbi:MAG: MBL fold metallo-hydrolase [Candidatus Limnocylindrales bacterium]
MLVVRLTVVGSAPAYALRPGHASSCYLIEADGGDGSDRTAILLDIGQGAFAALGEYLEPSMLAAIFISHLHPDHGIDIVPMRHFLHYALDELHPVPLHAPAEFRSRIDGLIGEPGFLDGLPGDDLTAGQRTVGVLTIEARPVKHALNSFAFRVSSATERPGVVYSGDCGRPDDLIGLVRPGDTFLCEASWGAALEIPTGAMHLTAREAAEVARDCGAARLLLTHVLDEHDPVAALDIARGIFRGPVELAVPGMVVDVG